MSDASDQDPPSPLVGAEPVTAKPRPDLSHLAENRGLIIRRALLSTAVTGLVPLPVLDEVVGERIRSGLYMKIAQTRNVDVPANVAEVLAPNKGASVLRQATFAAAGVIAIKLAWRKVLAVLALGRGAEDMAAVFQAATLFDHYCARMHVGGALGRNEALKLRHALHAAIDVAGGSSLIAKTFGEGSRILGRSLLEAPRWVGTRLQQLTERWVRAGGNTKVALDPEADLGELESEARWLDRAAQAVEERLVGLGQDYLTDLVLAFEAGMKAPTPSS